MTVLSVRPLTPREVALLNEAEETIAAGLTTFIEVGQALLVVRDERLYRRDFLTFEDYCVAKWQISRSHAYRLMDAASAVSPIGDTDLPLPMNEAQARALVDVPEERRVEVWSETLERTDNRPTAAAIRAAAEHLDATSPAPSRLQRQEETGGAGTSPDAGTSPVDVPATDPGVAAPAGSEPSSPEPGPFAAGGESEEAPDKTPVGVSSGSNLIDTPVGPVTPAVAAALAKHVPDPDPHADWRIGYLKRIHAVHAVIRSKPADVAEMADEQCLDELRRCTEALQEYRREVVRAVMACTPDNVTPIRRTS